ncbi:hypothetical protein [Thermostichus vulcanus]|nr:hypothetical protein [Thermostichus vulcanus]
MSTVTHLLGFLERFLDFAEWAKASGHGILFFIPDHCCTTLPVSSRR